MSIVQIIILSIIGLAGGGIIAAGVFALITTTGVMTRFAEKTCIHNDTHSFEQMSDNMKMKLLLVQFYLIYSGCLN